MPVPLLPDIPPPPRITDVGISTRLRAQPRLHALVPASLDLAAHRRRHRRRLSDPRYRAHAVEAMEHVVGATPRAPEVAELAERWVDANAEREALVFRPSILDTPVVEGAGNAAAALAGPTGAVVTFAHLSAYIAVFPALKAVAGSVYTVGAPRYFQATDRGADALAIRRHRDVIESSGHPFLPAPGSKALLRDALLAGHTVALAFDVEGAQPVQLLGRRVGVAIGVSQLAVETGSPVLPVVLSNDGPTMRAAFQAPLQPGDDPAALAQRIVDVFEPVLLARPWSLHDPDVRWTFPLEH